MTSLETVRWIDVPSQADARGVLTAIEGNDDVPFEIKRVFYMHNIAATRGGHAHRDTDQLLIAISGSFTAQLTDGQNSALFELSEPTKGLFIPRMVFIDMYDFSPGSVVLVLASTHYDRSRSIRSEAEYLEAVGAKGATGAARSLM